MYFGGSVCGVGREYIRINLFHIVGFEVVCAFGGREALDQRSNRVSKYIDGALSASAQQRLGLGECIFDWIEFGALGQQQD